MFENAVAHLKKKETPLEKLEKNIKKVDLINTLQQDLKDDLVKFTDESGKIQPFKVPQKLYIVAIIHEVIKAAKELKLGICVRHSVIFMYTGTYWQSTDDEDVKRVLSRFSIKLGFYSPSETKTFEFREKLFKQFMQDGVEQAGSPTHTDILINLNNGTLEINKNSVRLREHRREDFLTYCLHYDYQPDAVCNVFRKYLDEVLPLEDTKAVIQEFTGYIFTTNLKLEKSAVLYGGGANGKSVFFEVITALLGEENTSSKGLGDLCSKGTIGMQSRAEIENKLLNYASELSPRGTEVEIFKALVSGEPTSAKRLFRDIYTFRSTAKMIFNANKLPNETESTEGFFRRFLIIPFSVTIAENKRDKNLHHKIIDKELGGVLNWAIVGLKRLLENEAFSNSAEVDGALADFKKQSNSVLLFIEEFELVKDEYGFTSTTDMYNSYTEFCNSSGHHRFNKNNFSKELVSIGFETLSKKVADKTKRGFKVEFGG